MLVASSIMVMKLSSRVAILDSLTTIVLLREHPLGNISLAVTVYLPAVVTPKVRSLPIISPASLVH